MKIEAPINNRSLWATLHEAKDATVFFEWNISYYRVRRADKPLSLSIRYLFHSGLVQRLVPHLSLAGVQGPTEYESSLPRAPPDPLRKV